MPSIHKWSGKLTLLSPLSHGADQTLSNHTKFRRLDVAQPDGTSLGVPCYSGNAFRGKLRRLIAADLVELLGTGTEPQMFPKDVYYGLFAGGALEKGSTSRNIEVGWRVEARRLVPALSLLGTARKNQMLQGKLSVGMAWPIAKETVSATGIISDACIWEMVQDIQYTRRDDHEGYSEAEKQAAAQGSMFGEEEKGDKKEKETGPQQMLYQIECLIPGTVLDHSFGIRDATDLELSCFGRMMRLFEEQPVLGSKSGSGHGRVKPEYEPEWPEDSLYLEHVAENKDGILEILGL